MVTSLRVQGKRNVTHPQTSAFYNFKKNLRFSKNFISVNQTFLETFSGQKHNSL